jgi:hypothetical protein
MSNKGYGKNVRSVVRKEERALLNKLVNALPKAGNNKGGRKRNRNRNRKNNNRKGKGEKSMIREITDVPVGTSQRDGFNRNLASKILTKDEYIQDIAGTIDFTTTQFAVNPGQFPTFPWLSREAVQWEKYEFLKLEFYLKPEVTQYTAMANSGKVILSFDSDASDAPPETKQEAEDVMPMADGMSYQTISLNVPKFILNSHLDSFYVRPKNLPGGSDIKTYDLGNLFVSTIGQGGAVPSMMELRVRYTCKFMIPILESVASAPQNNSSAQFYDFGRPLVTSVASEPLYDTPSSVPNGIFVANGLSIVNDGGVFIPPPGNYLVSYVIQLSNDLGEEITSISGYLEKNNINQFDSTSSWLSYVGAPVQYMSLSGTQYMSFNGTDSLFTSVVAYFTAGDSFVSSLLTLVSV